MGYDLGKRLSDLRKQTDEDLSARWRVKRTVFLCFLGFIVARYLIIPTTETPSKINAARLEQSNTEETESQDLWIEDTKVLVTTRIQWLKSSPLVLFPGTSSIYEKIARSLDLSFNLAGEEEPNESDLFFSISEIPTWWNRMVVGAILRSTFVVLAFWPLWVLGLVAGIFLMKYQNKKRPNNTILGVCDRALGPFYSGIYGPYRPNNKISGTEMSCPGLACPKLSPKEEAEKHPLKVVLNKFNAESETNFELVRVILAHKDFPHFVAEENSIHGDDSEKDLDASDRVSKTGFISNEKGTLLDGVSNGLPAILEAHLIAKNYIEALKKNGLTIDELESNYPAHVNSLKKASSGISKVAQILLNSLTPARIWAISQLQPNAIASAYLAIEAGKALVYKRINDSFTTVSLYPHLQARAVIQSITSYHFEYDGDTRLIIRQAILSCRRHGDFGRSFLPIRMTAESRAIRDWLEIMYSEDEKKEEISNLVELDAHMDDIHINYKTRFLQRIKTNYAEDPVKQNHKLWMGLVYKSVLLVPLDDLINTALHGLNDTRLERILKLLNLTKKYQNRISTSARLPGFKRQAMEADKGGDENDEIIRIIKNRNGGKKNYDRWLIVRRMLTRYNWLSTRIGDESVPVVGVLHGILKLTQPDLTKRNLSMEVIVPLRERRFNEILGKNFQNTFYRFSPYQDSVEVFTKSHEFKKRELELRTEPAPEEIETPEKVLASA